MKKIFAVAALSLLLPLTASAASFYSGESYLLGKEEAVPGDLYVAGNSMTIEGAVTGDVTSAGSTLLFTGSASQDLQAAGGTLTIIGNVGDDVRAAGGSITFGSSARGDALLAGGDVTTLPSMVVGGDMYLAGGRVLLSGVVQGRVRVHARDVTINGTISGPLSISADTVTFGPNASLAGTVTYSAGRAATVVEGAAFSGEVIYEPLSPHENSYSPLYWAKTIGVWFVLKLLMIFLGCLVMSLYYRRAVLGLAARFFDGFGWNVLIGFAFLVATPFAAVLLMMTVVGLLIGILVLLIYGAMLIINTLYLPALVGGEIYRYFKREAEMKVSVLTIVIGTVALAILSLVPVVGWIVAFILMLGTLGAGIRFKWSELKSYR
ncbi:MAG TPA: polymer-forming cytoskeletal protein [Candidatus Paceibacterota bacterium]|nr:polymer-forming cytoskeletal protein [Candidatus Paceibacterota bacterium]